MPDLHEVHKREFDNACLKLTAVMKIVTQHSHDDESPHRKFSLDLLDILTGAVPVIVAGDSEARAKALQTVKELGGEAAPIQVTAEEVSAANASN